MLGFSAKAMLHSKKIEIILKSHAVFFVILASVFRDMMLSLAVRLKNACYTNIFNNLKGKHPIGGDQKNAGDFQARKFFFLLLFFKQVEILFVALFF